MNNTLLHDKGGLYSYLHLCEQSCSSEGQARDHRNSSGNLPWSSSQENLCRKSSHLRNGLWCCLHCRYILSTAGIFIHWEKKSWQKSVLLFSHKFLNTYVHPDEKFTGRHQLFLLLSHERAPSVWNHVSFPSTCHSYLVLRSWEISSQFPLPSFAELQ